MNPCDERQERMRSFLDARKFDKNPDAQSGWILALSKCLDERANLDMLTASVKGTLAEPRMPGFLDLMRLHRLWCDRESEFGDIAPPGWMKWIAREHRHRVYWLMHRHDFRLELADFTAAKNGMARTTRRPPPQPIPDAAWAVYKANELATQGPYCPRCGLRIPATLTDADLANLPIVGKGASAVLAETCELEWRPLLEKCPRCESPLGCLFVGHYIGPSCALCS